MPMLPTCPPTSSRLAVRCALLLTGSLLLSACGASEPALQTYTDPLPYDTLAVENAERLPAAPATPPPRSAAVAHLIDKALRTDGSISRPELVQRLGLPLHTTVETVANQYDSSRTDTVRTLVYRGLRAMLYETSPRTFLIRLVLTDHRYLSPEGLRVGMPPQQVVSTIGPPTAHDRRAGELIYAEHDTMPTALILTVRRGQVTKIAWEFYFS